MIPLFVVPRRISWVTQAVLHISLAGFVPFLVVSLAMSKNKQSGRFIVQSGLGTSGWGDGTAWVLGITNAMYAFGGTDGGKRVPGWRLYLTITLLTWRLAIHISEEIAQPGRRVPQVMIMTMIISFITSFSLLFALMFCTADLHAVASSQLSSMELVYQAYVSRQV